MPPISVVELGTISYAEAERLQARLVAARQAGKLGDVLLLLEHPPVVTLGRNARRENVRVTAAEFAALGVACMECNRGGDVTFHGPGQLVGYPVVDLRQSPRPTFLGAAAGRPARLGPVDYMRALEEVLIRVAAGFGLAAHRSPGRTGVWCGAPEAKLAALGVHIARGVTSHGFALNVTTDLALFSRLIVPCGLADRGVTSLERELSPPPPMAAVRGSIVHEFGRVFERAMAPVALEVLLAEAPREEYFAPV